jgi:hypothetical protein
MKHRNWVQAIPADSPFPPYSPPVNRRAVPSISWFSKNQIPPPWSKPVSQKIVGNFVVGTVYSANEIGQWTGTYVVRRYGVNNGRVIALQAVPGLFTSCAEAAERAMELGEEFAKSLDPDTGGISAPGSGDELFIPPSSSAQPRNEASL